jgi:carbamoyltransferase
VNILGLSAYYHDSAACLVQDGRIVAAAQEERFTRKKHDYRFPTNAVDFCLAEGGIRIEDLDLVTFYDKPLLKFDRLLETYIAYAPSGFKLFLMGMPLWLREKLHTPRELDRSLKGRYAGRFVFTEHHESHAASAFFPSPFEEAAILTLDGVGEWATGSIARRPRQSDPDATRRCASRTPSVCSTRPSRTSRASRSTAASTSSWASRPTASRSTRIGSSRSSST